MALVPWHGGAVASTVTSQQEGSEFEPTSAWSLHVACVGFLRVLWLPPTIQRHAGDSKLSVGVRLSGFLSLYVGPVTDWRLVQGVPRRSPNDSWD